MLRLMRTAWAAAFVLSPSRAAFVCLSVSVPDVLLRPRSYFLLPAPLEGVLAALVHPKRSAEREALVWAPAGMKRRAILLLLAADFEAVLKTVETQSHYVAAAPASDLLKPFKEGPRMGTSMTSGLNHLPDLCQRPQA